MKRTFVVVGLGTFGMRTAQALYAGGADVLAIDQDEQVVAQVSPMVTRAVCADATDEKVLSTVGAFDDYFVVFKTIVGGTRGVAGVLFQVSLDAGRNFGPQIPLGTAVTYAIPNDNSTFIKKSIEDVEMDLIFGSLLTVLII